MIFGEGINEHSELGVVIDKGQQVGYLLHGITLLLSVAARLK